MYASLYIEDRRVQLFNINDVDNANLADFTILCQAGKVKAHKVVLSTRCNYFRIMIDEDHRVEQADFPGISHEVMKQVLRLIYGEEVLVADKHFTRFIKLCQLLQVKYQVRFEIDQARKLSEKSVFFFILANFFFYSGHEANSW